MDGHLPGPPRLFPFSSPPPLSSSSLVCQPQQPFMPTRTSSPLVSSSSHSASPLVFLSTSFPGCTPWADVLWSTLQLLYPASLLSPALCSCTRGAEPGWRGAAALWFLTQLAPGEVGVRLASFLGDQGPVLSWMTFPPSSWCSPASAPPCPILKAQRIRFA